jgi:hypothetical protein
MVSRVERNVLALRISSVMKGLWGLDEHVMDFRGACLSRRLESVELN